MPEDAPIFLQEDCAKSFNGKVPLLLCFCCPMMEFMHYQQLYVGKDFSLESTPRTSDSKDITQLHSKFAIRKNNGEAFTRTAQKDFLDGFHSDEELTMAISHSALAIDRGSGHDGLRYPGDSLSMDHWHDNMGDDLANTDVGRLLVDTEEGISGWKMITSSTNKPVPQEAQLGLTEYSWMLGGKCSG
jgi:hypothetical protein